MNRGLKKDLLNPSPAPLSQRRGGKATFYSERLSVLCIPGTSVSPGPPRPGTTSEGSAGPGEGLRAGRRQPSSSLPSAAAACS